MRLTLNLATRAYLNRRALYAFYAALTGALVLGLLLLGLSLLHLHRQGQVLERQLAELNRQLGQSRPTASRPLGPVETRKLQQQVAAINTILSQSAIHWTTLLDRLGREVPNGVVVRAIQPDSHSGLLELKGEARRVADLRTFLDRLLASPHFGAVYLRQQGRIKVKDTLGRERQAVDFSISLKGAF